MVRETLPGQSLPRADQLTRFESACTGCMVCARHCPGRSHSAASSASCT
ncbi:MAG: 4Fe-4S binding protein [Ignavibacteriales bacterium]|nr:4Fe-4S binding protein [Ignavibacteriales bacterium]